jgi:glycine cleavage system H protein
MEHPDELLYSEEHTWVSIKDDIATIGITLYAAEELDNILAVDMPQVGDIIDQGESFGTLESSKVVSDIFAPISGEVVEVNNDSVDDPAMINEYPYDDGWLIKVKPSDENEQAALLSAIKYEIYVKEEKQDDDDDDDDDNYDDE